MPETNRETFAKRQARIDRSRTVRRTLALVVAGTAVAIALSKSPIPDAASKALRGDQSHEIPASAEANIGGNAKIKIQEVSENGNTDVLPHLRLNPFIGNGYDSNTIPWTDVAKIEDATFQLKDGTEILIHNPVKVTGQNPDDPLNKGSWGILEITTKDGIEENAYYSISSGTAGLVELDNKGLNTPIKQSDGPISNDLNQVSINYP